MVEKTVQAAGGLGDMSTATPRGVGNSGVLTIAGAVAGAISGIALAIVRSRERRRQPPSRLVQLRETAEAKVPTQEVGQIAADAASRASAAVLAAVPIAVAGGQQLGLRARQEAQRAQSLLGERARETQSVLGDLSREAQSALADRLEKREEMADRASSIVEDLSKRSREGARTLRSQSETYAAEGLHLVRGVGETASEAAQQWVPEVRERVEKQVVPKLHDLSDQASDRAHVLYDVAREQASALRRTAEKDVLPAVTDLSAQARESIGTASHNLSEEASVLGERLADVSSVAAERASGIGRKAQYSTKQAADATVQGGRDLGSIIFWLAIGSAIIYYALLNDQQRERVKRLAQGAFSEGRNVYQDIQGRDEEFT